MPTSKLNFSLAAVKKKSKFSIVSYENITVR